MGGERDRFARFRAVPDPVASAPEPGGSRAVIFATDADLDRAAPLPAVPIRARSQRVQTESGMRQTACGVIRLRIGPPRARSHPNRTRLDLHRGRGQLVRLWCALVRTRCRPSRARCTPRRSRCDSIGGPVREVANARAGVRRVSSKEDSESRHEDSVRAREGGVRDLRAMRRRPGPSLVPDHIMHRDKKPALLRPRARLAHPMHPPLSAREPTVHVVTPTTREARVCPARSPS